MSDEKKTRKKAEKRKPEGAIDYVVKVRAAEKGSAGSKVKGSAKIRVFLWDGLTVHEESDKLIEQDFRNSHEYYNRLVRNFEKPLSQARALVAGPEALKQQERTSRINVLYKARYGLSGKENAEKRAAVEAEIEFLKKERKESWTLVQKERTELREQHNEEIKQLISSEKVNKVIEQEQKGVMIKYADPNKDPVLNLSNYKGIEDNFKLAAAKAFGLRSQLHLRGEDFRGEAPSDFRSYDKWDGSGCIWSRTQTTSRHLAVPEAVFGKNTSTLIRIRPFEEEDLKRFDLPDPFWSWIQTQRTKGRPDEWYVLLSARDGNNKTKTWYGAVIRIPPGSKSSAGPMQKLLASNYIASVQYHRAKVGHRLETHVNFTINSNVTPAPAGKEVKVSFDIKGDDVAVVLTTAGSQRKISLQETPAFIRAAYAEDQRKKLSSILSQHRKTAFKMLSETLSVSPDLLWDREGLPDSRWGFRQVYHQFKREMIALQGEKASKENRSAVFKLIFDLYRRPGPDGTPNPYGGDHPGAVFLTALELQSRFRLTEAKAQAMATVYLFVERLNHLSELMRSCTQIEATTRKEFFRNLSAELVADYDVTWEAPPEAGRMLSDSRKNASLSLFKMVLKTAAVRAGRRHSGFETKKAKKIKSHLLGEESLSQKAA